MQRRRHAIGLGIGVLVLAARLSARANWDLETYLSDDKWKRLDTYETLGLQRADKSFAARDYTKAFAEYKAFAVEFPKTTAMSYALLRQGRCKQRVEKRFEAVQLYNDVLDYFPNDVNEAAAALYYIGECQMANGNAVEAMKAFTELADDEDYRKHRLAAGAMLELARNLQKQDKYGEAAKRFEELAIAVRYTRPDVAKPAIDEVLTQYIVRGPDKAKLREFFQNVHGFDFHAIQKKDMPPDDDPDPAAFWGQMLREIDARARHVEGEAARSARARMYGYWSEQMTGRFADWDDYQVHWIDYGFHVDGNGPRRLTRLDEQFQRKRTAGDVERVFEWMQIFARIGAIDKVMEYAQKLDAAKLSVEQVIRMMAFMWDSCNRPDLARQTMGNLNLVQRDDEFKVRMAWWFGERKNAEGFLHVVGMVKDEDRRDFEMLKFYANPKGAGADPVVLESKALPLAERLTGVDTYAVQAWAYKADIFEWLKRWADCIKALRNFPNPDAQVFYRIAECLARLGDIDGAVTQLRQIEQFFPPESANAVWRVTGVYRQVGQRAKEIAVLHEIMARYKKAQVASRAHERLEALGVPIRGGEEAQAD